MPCGLWHLSVEGKADAEGPFEFFIQRDDSIEGFRRRGRQSAFVDPNYRVYSDDGRIRLVDDGPSTHVRRAGSISSFASAPGLVVAASRYADTDEDAAFSGLPARPGCPKLERVTSERSRLRRGIRAAASLSGSRTTAIGTSFAAALQVRREVAELGGPPVSASASIWRNGSGEA
jgi:hypothetical protein